MGVSAWNQARPRFQHDALPMPRMPGVAAGIENKSRPASRRKMLEMAGLLKCPLQFCVLLYQTLP